MPSRYLRPGSPTDDLRADFDRIRAEFDVTVGFPDDVAAEAEQRAQAPLDTAGRVDLTDVPWVTIDPPGSMDLDQAMHLERTADGFVVRYAIADVAAHVPSGVAARTGGVEARHHRLLPGHQGAPLPHVAVRGRGQPVAGPDAAGDRLHDPARRRGRAHLGTGRAGHRPQHREARLRERGGATPGGDRPAADGDRPPPRRGQPERSGAGGGRRPLVAAGISARAGAARRVGGLERRDLPAGGDGGRRPDGRARLRPAARDGRRGRVPADAAPPRRARAARRVAGGRAATATSSTGSTRRGRATPRSWRRRAA